MTDVNKALKIEEAFRRSIKLGNLDPIQLNLIQFIENIIHNNRFKSKALVIIKKLIEILPHRA